MTAAQLFQYLLLFLLIGFTALNFYALTVGRKKKKQAHANYKQTLRLLEQRAYEKMQEHNVHFDEKQGYMNDLSEGILLTFDTKKKMVGITLKDAFYLFAYADFVSCKQTYETVDKNKLANISVEIETKDSIITLVFGSKSWKATSYLGKFLLSDTKEFCSLLESHCLGKELSQLT